MTVAITPFLRKTLLLDASVSGAAAVLMIAGAHLLEPVLNLPAPLLFWAGVVIVPFVAILLFAARQPQVPYPVLIYVIAANALWVVACFGLLLTGWVSPSLMGVAFVIAQALTVALFAELQFVALRRASAANA